MNFTFKHFIALNVLDIITTWYGLTFLGLSEQNTFANGIFQKYGLIYSLISMKIVGLMVIYGICTIYTPQVRKLAITISCLIFVAVVVNNLYWIYYNI
jgi:uncharacterized membrane protein YqjE